ncbi:MAG: ABC transporter permease [Chloroflexota bacterium]|nr:ABC transporter permease [Chloroflexota bacterium]MDE2858260.1 ABC transporter permease [Chloroflexota bacterium]MDE2950488.1 ABC transporter permease [Chloroflexota bacterium]
MNGSVARLAEDQDMRQSRSFWRDALAFILRDRLTIFAISVLAVATIVCMGSPLVIENALNLDVNETSVPNRFMQPGQDGYPLGTDQLGRDQFLRLIYGGRVSLTIAYLASVLTVFIGITLGMLAGYYGRGVDDLISWGVNTLSAIPPLFLLLIASAVWEPSTEVLIIVLAALGWVGTSRLVRGEVLSLKERDYVLAARALGASDFRIVVSHILPNVFSIVMVTMTIIAGNLILIESGLSYLGVGIQPPTPTWGNMLTDSRSYFVTGVHLVFTPGILIMITVLCFYLVGDGLRDALDPRRYQK